MRCHPSATDLPPKVPPQKRSDGKVLEEREIQNYYPPPHTDIYKAQKEANDLSR